jgi:citrate/tricarballylate utilization protein
MRSTELALEGERLFTICNACRYCEGYCAVFPAMERRLSFAQEDLDYLANLCHNCGECYYACQYAPPHEFAVNLPRTLATVRAESYQAFAWPQALAAGFARNGLTVATVIALVLAAALALASVMLGAEMFVVRGDGDFYRLIPHPVMVVLFGSVALIMALALTIAAAGAWRSWGEPPGEIVRPVVWREALADALTLKYLHGGGAGCTYPDARRSRLRRWLHHGAAYGFLLCFASTGVATVYHYGFGWTAPYTLTSLPVVLGTLGGVGLAAGTLGLHLLRAGRDRATVDPRQDGMDVAFGSLLFYVSLSGLALLALRSTGAMGPLLIVHLAAVAALFLTLPYGKFVHALYRLLALAKYALERRRPPPDVVGE